MNVAGIISLTINVACKLCGWHATYPVGQHSIAAADAAEHVVAAHPSVLVTP